MIFGILGIDETRDEQVIRAAYHNLLKNTNPEDDPEGFKRLRKAYEEAVEYARQAEEEEDGEEEQSEVQAWIGRVAAVYEDMDLRRQREAWERLLADPVCEELDTAVEAREQMLVFLMNHIYLPWAIWKLLDDVFGWTEDREGLLEKFPKNFLDYVFYYVKNDGFIHFDDFVVQNRERQNGDGYLEHYFQVKRKLDQGEWEGNLVELDQLSVFGLYHPYEDVERIRCCLMQAERETDGAAGLREKALVLEKGLQDRYLKDPYIQSWSAEALEANGHKEEAYKIRQAVLEEFPHYYIAKLGCARYQMEVGDHSGAKELLQEILNLDNRDEQAGEMLTECNSRLIVKYRDLLERRETDGNKTRQEMQNELGWCLFQNEKIDEAIALAESWEPEEKCGYDYYNLYGRLLYHAGQYEKAKPLLVEWLHGIEATVDDGTKEMQRRKNRLCNALNILGDCCHRLKEEEQAEEYLNKAITEAKDERERLGTMSYLAHMLLEAGRFEKAVDVCDAILEKDEGYFPALLTRQEAFFKLHKGQQVVDDYHRAVDIYKGFYQPYLLAAKVFFYYDQYEDAKGVLERAKENEVPFSDQMRLFEVKILRNLAQSAEEREEPLRLITELATSIGDETDLEDRSEIVFEHGLLLWDDDRNEEALPYITQAIEGNRERLQYRLVRGNILLDMKRYKEALAEYEEAEPDYLEEPALYYCRGLCYEAQDMKQLAFENFEKVLTLRDTYREACEKVMQHYKDEYHEHYRMEDMEKAIACMDRQLANRESCYYLVERGRLYMDCYQLERAIEDFEKALEYRPNDWASYNNIGCCYKYLGKFEKAIEALQKAADCMTEDEKSVLPYSNMADCYEALGKYREAIDCYEKDLQLFPDRNSLWEYVGDLYTYLGEEEQAIKAYRKLEEKGDYAVNRAYICEQRGRVAGTVFWRLCSVFQTEKKKRTKRWVRLVDTFLDWNPGAAVFCSKVVEPLLDHSDYYKMEEFERERARQYFLMGNDTKAREHAKKAMEYFQKETNGTKLEDYLGHGYYAPARHLNLAWLFILLGEQERGLEYLEQSDRIPRCRLCRHKSCYEKYYYRGLYREVTGDLAGAMEDYQTAQKMNSHAYVLTRLITNLRKKMERQT